MIAVWARVPGALPSERHVLPPDVDLAPAWPRTILNSQTLADTQDTAGTARTGAMAGLSGSGAATASSAHSLLIPARPDHLVLHVGLARPRPSLLPSRAPRIRLAPWRARTRSSSRAAAAAAARGARACARSTSGPLNHLRHACISGGSHDGVKGRPGLVVKRAWYRQSRERERESEARRGDRVGGGRQV